MDRVNDVLHEGVQIVGILFKVVDATDLGVKRHEVRGESLSPMVIGEESVTLVVEIVEEFAVLEPRLGETVEDHDHALWLRMDETNATERVLPIGASEAEPLPGLHERNHGGFVGARIVSF